MATSIYGTDDRVDYYQLESDALKSLTSSVAIRIPTQDINVGPKSYKLRSHRYGEKHILCKDEKFYNQTSVGDCTGFLIESDTLVTAGHCVQSKADCNNSYWLFDYKVTSEGHDTNSGTINNLFRCKSILFKKMTFESKTSRNADIDFAIIKLDRATNRSSLNLAKDKVLEGDDLIVMGYPKGLPLKIASNAKTQSLDFNTFFANLDTYSGNSGSPVFNEKTLEVVGILTAGKMDFSAKREYGKEQCQYSAVYRDDPNSSETINYIQNIFTFIK